MVSLVTSFYFFHDFSKELSREKEMELFIIRIMFKLRCQYLFVTFILDYCLDDENNIN